MKLPLNLGQSTIAFYAPSGFSTKKTHDGDKLYIFKKDPKFQIKLGMESRTHWSPSTFGCPGSEPQSQVKTQVMEYSFDGGNEWKTYSSSIQEHRIAESVKRLTEQFEKKLE